MLNEGYFSVFSDFSSGSGKRFCMWCNSFAAWKDSSAPKKLWATSAPAVSKIPFASCVLSLRYISLFLSGKCPRKLPLFYIAFFALAAFLAREIKYSMDKKITNGMKYTHITCWSTALYNLWLNKLVLAQGAEIHCIWPSKPTNTKNNPYQKASLIKNQNILPNDLKKFSIVTYLFAIATLILLIASSIFSIDVA